MFGKSPAMDYLGLEEHYLITAVDFACACAFWEQENHLYSTSKETAGNEAVAIGQELENYRKQLEDR